MNRIAIALVVLTVLGAPAFADSNYTYLALGDSVPFGMNVTLLPPYSQQTPVPSQFVDYPEIVAASLHVVELNASCPGETSASFLSLTNIAMVPDNGCNSPHVVPPPPPPSMLPPVIIPSFKSMNLLHTNYSGAQIDFALSQLKANPRIDLVTLNIGANDVLLVLPQLAACNGDPKCMNNVLTPALQTTARTLVRSWPAFGGNTRER
jgi:hypothetical protein